jgi:hypothetical protein
MAKANFPFTHTIRKYRDATLYRSCSGHSDQIPYFVSCDMVDVDKGDSGQPVYRHFCGGCGSPVFAKIASAPGKVVVKAGTLDSEERLQPKTEIYTDHAVKWLAPVAGTARFAQNL